MTNATIVLHVTVHFCGLLFLFQEMEAFMRCSEGNFPWLFSMSEGDILLKCLIIGRQSCPESSLRKPQAVVGEGGQSGLLSVIIN